MSHSPSDSNSALAKSRSSFAILGASLGFCARHLLTILKIGWPLLVTLEILEFFSDQYFDFVAEMIQRRGIESVTLIGGTAFLEFLVGLVFTAAWFLATLPLLQYLPTQLGIENRDDNYEVRAKPRFARSLRLHLNSLLIEETRVFAAILRRIPFLLIPAPIEYLRLCLVPYVVVLDDGYRRGNRDALEASRLLTRRRWLLLAGVFALTVFLPFALKEWVAGEGNIWFWEHPVRMILSAVTQFFANLAGSMVLFAVYEMLVSEMDESATGHVSLS